MDDKVKELLQKAGEKLQRFRFYLVKQYKRQRRDLRRFLHPKDGGTWQVHGRMYDVCTVRIESKLCLQDRVRRAKRFTVGIWPN